MNSIIKTVATLLFFITASFASASITPEVQNTYDDIKATFGVVPSFMKNYPPEGITGAWELMKAVQFSPNTSIPPKYKELIGLGVAAQIPCNYCVYFHTEAAKSNGATDAEIHEAIAMAGFTRYWSTYLNGVQVNEATYDSDINKVVDFAKSKSKATPDATDSNSRQTTYDDIQKTLGSIPAFYKMFPDFALPGAWKNMKDFVINPNTAIPPKYKELIGLGVSSQIPCSFCTLAHTEFAKVNNATESEVQEAVLVAAGTRQWSTILNGLQTDEAAFKKETNAMMKFVKNKNASK
jgi:AhpD family alkylhydroperoxidase